MMDFFHTWLKQTIITGTASDLAGAIKEFTVELKRHNDLVEKMRSSQLPFAGPKTADMLSLRLRLEDKEKSMMEAEAF